MHRALPILALVIGCKSGKASLDWGGPEVDARLVADVFTWECAVWDTGSDSGTTKHTWQGVFAQVVTLEFAPDAIETFSLPSPGGCSASVDLFPTDAGPGASSLPDPDDTPRWETDVDEGELDELTTGYWRDDVFEDFRSCRDVTDVLSGGTRLRDADVLTGIATPEPDDAPEVEFSGLSTDPSTGASYIDWGDEITMSWDQGDWDEVWVQIRREREGEAWESVVCNATDLGSFTLTSDVWSLMDGSVEVERNNIYVGFQRVDEVQTDEEVTARTYTRSIAVAVVTD